MLGAMPAPKKQPEHLQGVPVFRRDGNGHTPGLRPWGDRLKTVTRLGQSNTFMRKEAQ